LKIGMNFMRILALVHSLPDTAPGQRFRIEQWEPLLRQSGVEITFAPFECEELHQLLHQPGRQLKKFRLILQAMARRVRVMASVREYDAVYVFREAALLGPPLFEYWATRAGVPVIFDFDDAIFVPVASSANGYLSYFRFPWKTSAICRMSAHVMAGNPHLADYSRRFNDQVTVIPTTIDTDKYQVAPPTSANVPVIGWSGSFSTVQHLDTLCGALQRLARTERFKLRVIGTPRYQLDGVEVEARAWRSETELQDLSEIDIGVMPLPDDRWSRGKCGLKALQYMALGIPAVCSPVGVNTDIIRDGENGFLAASEDEWVQKLTQLLHSAELRARLGAAGRATVEATYSAVAQAPRVRQIFAAAARANSPSRASLESVKEK
jgi:glycosyltransferase involved in cell wall biosynthesis